MLPLFATVALVRQLSMSVYFISDLHLDDSQPKRLQALLQLLQHIARDAEQLYVLGDLFEVWIGDDAMDETAQTVCAAFKSLAQQGCSVAVMAGNRDFLYGDDFCQHSSCQLLPDEWMIDTPIGPCALLHGDTLCLEDTTYLEVRKLLRSSDWQQQFLQQTPQQRRQFASAARAKSAEHTANTAMDIMDVTTSAVEQNLNSQGAKLMIHGHTHRPKLHQHQNGHRLVLGDWQQQAWFACMNANQLALYQFDTDAAAGGNIDVQLIEQLSFN